MPTLQHEGLQFAYSDGGQGVPFVFQHGLGGDAAQPASQAPGECRLITLECRGHGQTPLGPEDALGFETFARDVDALLDQLGLANVVAGGISMGAGVALRLASLRPDRVRALVLVRPAWVDRSWPPNLHVYAEIARLLREYGPREGKDRFVRESGAYRRAAQSSPAVAASLAAQFERALAREHVAVLERLPADRPIGPRADWCSLSVPALVIGARDDAVHPFDYATALHQRLPSSAICEVPSNDAGEAVHRRAVAAVIGRFLAGRSPRVRRVDADKLG